MMQKLMRQSLKFQNASTTSKVIEDLKQQVAALQSKLQAQETASQMKMDQLQAKLNSLEASKDDFNTIIYIV